MASTCFFVEDEIVGVDDVVIGRRQNFPVTGSVVVVTSKRSGYTMSMR